MIDIDISDLIEPKNKIKTLIDLNNLPEHFVNQLKHKCVEVGTLEVMKQFEVTNENRYVINNMFYYFLGTEKTYDLKKGIMLCGTFGVGKTTLFNVIRRFINTIFPFNQNAFILGSIEEIITEKDLMNSKYVYNVSSGNRVPKHLLINEFGHKYNIKNYGSDSDDIVEGFLMKRYDIFQYHKKLTHFTTNLGKEELIAEYPPVIIDRFREMCNIVELGGNSFRK
jgi:DNA replication protein DnaC